MISISGSGSAILKIGDLVPTGDPGAPLKRNSVCSSEKRREVTPGDSAYHFYHLSVRMNFSMIICNLQLLAGHDPFQLCDDLSNFVESLLL